MKKPVQMKIGRPTYRPVPEAVSTISVRNEHKKYIVGGVFCFGLFAVVLIVALVRVGNSVGAGVESLTSGHLHRTIDEAHKALQSARRVTDSLPLKEAVQHWGETNKIIAEANIPWKELPQWRTLAENAFRTIKKHPEWAKELKESTNNLKETASPLATESKEWRKSFGVAARTYAQALMALYAPNTPNDTPLEKKVEE